MSQSDLLEVLKSLSLFSENFFKIRTKDGSVKQFVFNRAQKYIDKRLNDQKASTGRVRATILKGRQQGCSTYVQARYFHKVITQPGTKCFILTHETSATKNLFEMTKRYYENLPQGLCPTADRDSTKDLNFNSLDSGYSIGTAGNKGVGRSQTIQLLHGSEVGYWHHAQEHAQGLMQAVGTQSGTEIILESTAQGIGNYFHEMWTGAESGSNGYQAIFVPWYWQDEYTDFTAGYIPNDEEAAIYEQYKADGMTFSHLAWRRLKISEFSKDYDEGLDKFNQEYPNTSAIAFRNPIQDTFINAKWVNQARKTDIESDSPLIIGVDPAISDRDRCAIVRRKGRKIVSVEALRNYNTMELAGYLKSIIERERPLKVFVDCIGIGAGTTDRLREMGFECVEGVNVARTANNKEIYYNLRSEIWDEMKKWLMGELPVDIPDRDDLHADLCSLGRVWRSDGRLQLESKQNLRARGMPSCDLADALALTFTFGQHAGDTVYKPVFMPTQHKGMFT